jgi:hypothetical protein
MATGYTFLLALALGALFVTARQQEAPQPGGAGAVPPAAPAPTPPAVPADQAAASQPADAATLLSAFAQVEGLEARFSEEKHLALLAAPLVSRGRLYFLRPGYLTRVVEEPERATLTIAPDELRMSGREGVETIDLRSNDRVRVFVTSLVQVFSGDRAALERSYDVAYSVGETGWTLTLTPRAEALAAMLRDLTLRGSGVALAEIVVRDPGGDRTVTRIEATDAARRFTEEERATLFGIGSR